MDRFEMDTKVARILIVDDTQANLDVLCALLEAEGYQIAMAPNGEVALRIAGRVRPDLILMDVMMPGLDGFEACRRLKQREDTQEIPVIFITAENLTQSIVTGFEVGGVDYIIKPFHSEEVLARVRTHLKIDRLTRDLEAANHALRIANESLSEANRQIQEATERKSRFLASMSHELRSPMTAIMGFTDLVLNHSGDALPEQHRDNLMKVRISADRLLNLINDILDLSRIEAGRIDIHPSSFRVRDLVASCCDLLNPLVKPGVTLRYEVSEEIGEAHTDPARLQQILTNLLSNALKFTEQGEVRVSVQALSPRPPLPYTGEGEDSSTASPLLRAGEGWRATASRGEGHPPTTTHHSPEDGWLEVAVSDTGVGIPSDALGYIFEEFRQVAGSPQKHKGTGLGLAITKRLTELLGGTVGVESEVGKGSTFTIRVPATYKGE